MKVYDDPYSACVAGFVLTREPVFAGSREERVVLSAVRAANVTPEALDEIACVADELGRRVTFFVPWLAELISAYRNSDSAVYQRTLVDALRVYVRAPDVVLLTYRSGGLPALLATLTEEANR